MTTVAAGQVVTLEYTVRLANGTVIDSTGHCGPVRIMVGAGQLFPPLDACLEGMTVGETREVRIPSDDAYGPRRPELVRVLPRDRLPPDLDLRIGGEYRLTAPDGSKRRFRLLAVRDAEVEVDFNPPGAGEELLGTLTVVAVRAPTPEEERRGRA